MVNILFTICGRAGSKGFKNKNLKRLDGQPLIYYTLSSIQLFRRAHPDYSIIIAVNTDSDCLVDMIKEKYRDDCLIYVERIPELAGDTVAKVEVIRNTYLCVKKETGIKFDAVIDLDITSPFRRLCDIEEAVNELVNDMSFDIVYSVVKSRRSPYFNVVEKKKDGFYRKVCDSSFTARQQAPESFELNASIYAYRPQMLENKIEKTILDYNCGIIIMPDYLVLDIDSETDFEMMGYLLDYFRKNDPGIFELCNMVNQ